MTASYRRTPTPFHFARSGHDRQGRHRTDPEWAAAQWTRTDPCVLVVGDGVVAMDGSRLRLLSPGEAPAGERAVLGTVDGQTYLAVFADNLADDLVPTPVRQAGVALDSTHGGLLVHALGLANWHRTHPRCARCGDPTEVAEAGHVRRCPSCQAVHFPRTDPAVIMLVTDDQDRALLGHQPSWKEGRYSTLAGFVEPGESLEDAVRREVHEEVGVHLADVTYAASQPWPFPSSLMLGFFATAETTEIDVDGREMADARWFTRDELTDLTANREVMLPGVVSISRWLIESWHGTELPGRW
ncbi:MAG TPA: NAD(+) diphosphatase [Nocardioidaceae bacterium]|nr:NAD(+) diphosphatase [Nocardioidaceae bacterium]